jgi:hypothetical protein
VAVPGSLQGLVGLLSNEYVDGHEIVVQALRNLAGDDANKKAIAAVPGCLHGLHSEKAFCLEVV